MSDKVPATRLLLVDDEEEFLAATSRALSRRGFEVMTAVDASAALALLERTPCEVAVVDVRMPGMAGDELFREIKRRWPSVAVIMLTGHGSMAQAFTTSKEGVHDYLTKPCDLEHLAEVVHRAAAKGKEAGAARQEEIRKEEIRRILERYQD